MGCIILIARDATSAKRQFKICMEVVKFLGFRTSIKKVCELMTSNVILGLEFDCEGVSVKCSEKRAKELKTSAAKALNRAQEADAKARKSVKRASQAEQTAAKRERSAKRAKKRADSAAKLAKRRETQVQRAERRDSGAAWIEIL